MGSEVKKLFDELKISPSGYKELEYFCLQYNEKKHEINNSYGLKSPQYGFKSKNKTISDTTLTAVEKILSLKAEIEMIEQSAIEADSEIYPYIIKNVTEGILYEYMDVPCGRRQFYEKRKLFFCILYMKRRKILAG